MGWVKQKEKRAPSGKLCLFKIDGELVCGYLTLHKRHSMRRIKSHDPFEWGAPIGDPWPARATVACLCEENYWDAHRIIEWRDIDELG